MIIMIPLMQLMLFGYAINTTPRDLPTAVLLQENSDLGRSILAALQEHRIFQGHRAAAQRSRARRAAGVRQGAVRGRDPGEFRARGAPRRQAGDAGRGRRHRSGRRRLGARRARPGGADRAVARPRRSRRRRAAVRDPHPCALQPGRRDPAQHRAGAGRHHPHHDHADLHRAVGDARDRARHHGKPAVDADHAGRDHARQDHPLCHGRLRAGGADHRHRRRAVRRADPRQPGGAGRA